MSGRCTMLCTYNKCVTAHNVYLFLEQLTCSVVSCTVSLLLTGLSPDPLLLLINCLSLFGNGCVSSSGGTSTALMMSLCQIHHSVMYLTCLCLCDGHCHLSYTCTHISLLYPLIHTPRTRVLCYTLDIKAQCA